MDIDEEARAPPEQTVNNSSLGETENPTGTHNDGLDTALMAINDNMGSMANLLGRLCARLDAGADNNTRSNHPTGSQRATGRKRQRSRSPHSSSEVHCEDEAATEDRLSVKASEDELEALVGGNNNPDKAGNINESEDSLLKELETAIQEEEKKGPKIRQQLADIALKRWGKKLRQEKLSGTLDKHYPPENCSDMNVPRINPEIWAQLNAFKKKADLRLANMQQTLQRASRKRILFCSFSPSVHTQTLIQRFRKSPFSPETETFENGFESGDFRKRRLSKTLRCRVEGRKQRLLKTVLI